jgi:hypothetical protein
MQERASSRPTYRRSSDFPEPKANAVHTPYKAGNTVRPTHRTNISVAGSMHPVPSCIPTIVRMTISCSTRYFIGHSCPRSLTIIAL